MNKICNPRFAVLVVLSTFGMQTLWLQAQGLPSAFHGKDLTGWRVPEKNIWWKAENGQLEANSGPQQSESTLWTEREYVNFVMEFDFKFGEGTIDSGIFVRDTTEQIQIGISGSLKRDMTASPYIAGKGYPVEAEGVKKTAQARRLEHDDACCQRKELYRVAQRSKRDELRL